MILRHVLAEQELFKRSIRGTASNTTNILTEVPDAPIGASYHTTDYNNTGEGRLFLRIDNNDVAADWALIPLFGVEVEGKARYLKTCGYKGNSGVNRWLQFFQGIPSETSPHIVAEPATIISLSVSFSGIDTATWTIYKNSILLDTITVTLDDHGSKTGLNHVLSVNDKISVKQTVGTVTDPILDMSIRVN